MIRGVGTDLVRIARIHRALSRFGERFARRILTDSEYREYTRVETRAHFLAKRFAAKEAAAKALGTGFRRGLALRHIGVSHNPDGQPALCFTGPAANLLELRSVTRTHLSISDEQDYAMAFVVLEGAERA